MSEKVDHVSLSNLSVLKAGIYPWNQKSVRLKRNARLDLSLTLSLYIIWYNGVWVGQNTKPLSWVERTGIQQTGLAPHYFCCVCDRCMALT